MTLLLGFLSGLDSLSLLAGLMGSGGFNSYA